MDCSICCYHFNQTTRKPVECLKCKKTSCISCIKKYIQSSVEDPHCVHCKHSWDLFFLNKILPRNYLTKEWRNSRSQLLFNRERSFFPQTMPLVAIEIEKEKINLQFKEIEEKEMELRAQKQELYNQLYHLNSEEKPLKINRFNIRQCPTPNCKGFLDNDYCIICNQKSCLKCNINILQGENHECKQEDIDTWQQIVKSSKPCPNCGTRIQKLSGCNQMWCLGCQVAFNWATGAIEKGPVHNPHYYEWAERLGLNHLETQAINDPCQGRRVWNFYNFYNVNIEDRSSFKNLHQKLNHIINHELVMLREKTHFNNVDLRIKYLRDLMNEHEYKKKLISREIQIQKNLRMVDTYDTMSMLVVQILNDFLKNQIKFNELEKKIHEVIDFANINIEEINKTFHSNIARISL